MLPENEVMKEYEIEELEKCTSCGDFHEFDDMEECGNGNMHCSDCFDEFIQCDDCGEWYPEDESMIEYSHVEGKNICDSCRDDYVRSDCCEELVNEYDIVITCDEDKVYCDTDCAHSDDAFFCDDCGDWYSYMRYGGSYDYNHYCDDCYDYELGVNIREYRNSPEPVFRGTSHNNRYFGVELEIDEGNRYNFSEELNEDTDNRIFLMEDGSLSCEHGVEVISHPMSMDEHIYNGLWEKVNKVALRHDMRSHDTDTCGLHVHVSRDSIIEEGESIDNVLFIVNRFWGKFAKFSRRESHKLDQWARRNVRDKDEKDVKLSDIKERSNFGRYHAVNISNPHTIEFRLFRGSLRPETIKSSIMLVDTVVCMAEFYSSNEYNIENISWKDIVKYAKKNYGLLYNELVRMGLE